MALQMSKKNLQRSFVTYLYEPEDSGSDSETGESSFVWLMAKHARLARALATLQCPVTPAFLSCHAELDHSYYSRAPATVLRRFVKPFYSSSLVSIHEINSKSLRISNSISSLLYLSFFCDNFAKLHGTDSIAYANPRPAPTEYNNNGKTKTRYTHV